VAQGNLILSLRVPAVAPSINSYYGSNGKRRFIKEAGVKYKLLVKTYYLRNKVTFKKDQLFRLRIEVTKNWLDKNKKINLKAGDADNFCKSSIDSFCEAIGINDALIFSLEVVKVFGKTNSTFYYLFEYP